MRIFLKSFFFIWLPVLIVLSIIHNAAWGDYDMSSFYFGAAAVFICQALEIVFDLEP